MSNITKTLTCVLFALCLISLSVPSATAQNNSAVAVVTAKRTHASGQFKNDTELEKQARTERFGRHRTT